MSCVTKNGSMSLEFAGCRYEPSSDISFSLCLVLSAHLNRSVVLPAVTTPTFQTVVLLSPVMGRANAWHRASKEVKPGLALLGQSTEAEIATSVYRKILHVLLCTYYQWNVIDIRLLTVSGM